MRCKNCGAENEDSRFICEICGSPLYDENDEVMNAEGDELEDTTDYNNDDEENAKKKRNIIIGIVVAVVAVAIIAGVVFALNSGKDEPDTSSTLSTSSTEASTKITTTKPKTTTTTTEPATTTTTEATTKPTTVTTTVATFTISVDIDGNGSVSGDGAYKAGKKATLIATADAGYQFAGRYDNNTGKLVASSNKYTVNVKSNMNLTAKFELAETVAAEPEAAE